MQNMSYFMGNKIDYGTEMQVNATQQIAKFLFLRDVIRYCTYGFSVLFLKKMELIMTNHVLRPCNNQRYFLEY